jgi:hypothetical protein
MGKVGLWQTHRVGDAPAADTMGPGFLDGATGGTACFIYTDVPYRSAKRYRTSSYLHLLPLDLNGGKIG